MNDIGKELYERVRADFERRLKSEKHPPKDMRGVSDYSARVGRYLAEAIAANVTEDALPDRRLYYNIAESILEPSLRTNYELVNDTAAEVQRLLDKRQGLRIKPARADYPEERVHAVIGAASEEGIEFDRALRRMTSPAENITQSFADDFMQANAEQRSKAGFDTFIERQGGFNCCPWCAGLVGVFAYPKGLPKEVFARHDNCTCSVTYGTKGGAGTNKFARQNAWTKAKWNVPPIGEPHRMTAEEAAEKGAFAQPKRLTGGANGGIISLTADRMGQPIKDNIPGVAEVKVYKRDGYKNIWTQTNSKNAQLSVAYIADRLANSDYGNVERVIIVKNSVLDGVAAYFQGTNTLYWSEELMDPLLFASLVNPNHFAAQMLDEIIDHELGGHKRHWDKAKELANSSPNNNNLLLAKQALEKELREYVRVQMASDAKYIKKNVSENADDAFYDKSSLNELIADSWVLSKNNRVRDEALDKLVKKVLGYET